MKTITHLLKSKRGISTVVGAALAILILITFFTGVYLWTASVQQSISQLDWQREQERIEIYGTFNLTDSDVTASLKVKNIGTIDVRLVGIWLITIDNEYHGFREISPPIAVTAGTVLEEELDPEVNYLTEAAGLNLTVKSSYNYMFKIVTERGNIATTTLVSQYFAETNYPVVLHPEVSNATRESIKLYVWNSLNEDVNVGVILIAPMHKNSTIESPTAIFQPVRLSAGKVCPIECDLNEEYLLRSELSNAWKVQIELVNENGFIIGKYYLPVG